MHSDILTATGDTNNIETLTIHGSGNPFDLTLEMHVPALGETISLDKRDGDWYARTNVGSLPSGIIQGQAIVYQINNIVKCFLDETKDL